MWTEPIKFKLRNGQVRTIATKEAKGLRVIIRNEGPADVWLRQEMLNMVLTAPAVVATAVVNANLEIYVQSEAGAVAEVEIQYSDK